jgi:hypothetical protein
MRVGVYVDGFNLYYAPARSVDAVRPAGDGWTYEPWPAPSSASDATGTVSRIAKVIYCTPPSTVLRILLDMLTRMSI